MDGVVVLFLNLVEKATIHVNDGENSRKVAPSHYWQLWKELGRAYRECVAWIAVQVRREIRRTGASVALSLPAEVRCARKKQKTTRRDSLDRKLEFPMLTRSGGSNRSRTRLLWTSFPTELVPWCTSARQAVDIADGRWTAPRASCATSPFLAFSGPSRKTHAYTVANFAVGKTRGSLRRPRSSTLIML